MRPKILVLIVAAVGLLLGIIFFVNQEFAAPEMPAGPESVVDNGTNLPAPAAEKAMQDPATAQSDPSTNGPGLPQPNPQETAEQTKEQKIEQLSDLATNDDNESLNTILHELDNPDKDIRSAALEAAIQFGETTNTIARLKELANRTSDAAEQKALLEAIEFIGLPSISELKPDPNSRPKAPKTQEQTPVPVPVPQAPPAES